jgi:hypothetical protein
MSVRTLLLSIPALLAVAPLAAQEQRNERFYYPGSFNWQFLKRYNAAGRLFNAFDYGHAVLYETLLNDSPDVRRRLEGHEFNYLTGDLLRRPPRFAVAEEAIEPGYAKLAWRAKQMFDWAHVLHRQIYDAYADERLTPAGRDSLIERLTDYYLADRETAFLPVPKSMALMDEQYYSQVFRREFPKFNGLIWAYHWLQVGLYEPLVVAQAPAAKRAGVDTAIARFWGMVEDSTRGFPSVMPMTPAIAPHFTAAHPRAAAIFDNLHMMHDIISDILASDAVPKNRKREVIYAALDEFQDSTRNVMSREEWLTMADHMGGIGAMGGPVLGEPAARGPRPHHDPGHRRHPRVSGGPVLEGEFRQKTFPVAPYGRDGRDLFPFPVHYPGVAIRQAAGDRDSSGRIVVTNVVQRSVVVPRPEERHVVVTQSFTQHIARGSLPLALGHDPMLHPQAPAAP